MTAPRWDVFVSHATEDKDAIARPLADELAERGYKVWYDEFALKRAAASKFAPLLDGANWAIISTSDSFAWSARLMSSVEHPSIYDELVDLLAQSADPARLGSFRLSAGMQDRLDELLQKNRDGTLDDSESAELDAFERFEHVVRILKARVVQQRGS